MLDITSIVCPVVTPFNDDNQVDAPCFRQILDFVIAGGVDAVMIAGTTGEGLLLSPRSACRLCETARTGSQVESL